MTIRSIDPLQRNVSPALRGGGSRRKMYFFFTFSILKFLVDINLVSECWVSQSGEDLEEDECYFL